MDCYEWGDRDKERERQRVRQKGGGKLRKNEFTKLRLPRHSQWIHNKESECLKSLRDLYTYTVHIRKYLRKLKNRMQPLVFVISRRSNNSVYYLLHLILRQQFRLIRISICWWFFFVCVLCLRFGERLVFAFGVSALQIVVVAFVNFVILSVFFYAMTFAAIPRFCFITFNSVHFLWRLPFLWLQRSLNRRT